MPVFVQSPFQTQTQQPWRALPVTYPATTSTADTPTTTAAPSGRGWVVGAIGWGARVIIGVHDTFDRPDSATTINPRSDGGTWTLPGVTAGILSNEGYIISGTGPIYADVGSLSTDVTVTDTRPNTNSASYLLFAWDDGTVSGLPDGFALEFDSSSTYLHIVDVRTLTVRYTVTGGTAWTTGSTTLRVTYDQPTSTITVYQNGTQIWQQVGATGPVHTGSNVGFKSIGAYSSTGETFNNFAAVAL